MQMQGIDSSCKLKGLIVVVKVILELGSEEYSSEEHLVGVETIETKVRLTHIVSIFREGYL